MMNLKKNYLHSVVIASLVGSAALLSSGAALANDSDELEKLRALVQELDQKIRVLDRKAELSEEKAEADRKAAPVIKAGSSGFSVESADKKNSIKLRGLLQADSRNYFSDDNPDINNEYTLRRVRPRLQGTFFNIFDFDINTDFAPAAAVVQDAFINARIQPWFQVQAGKFKVPVSLERIQSGGDLRFVERSYVSDSIAPNRDVGLQIHGNVLNEKLNYAVGVFDGQFDGQSNGSNRDNVANADGKEIAVRVFATPFKGEDSVLEGLGFGLSATRANGSDQAVGDSYRTPGQRNIFAYNGATLTDGDKTRFSPQAYYYNGPFGLITEYIKSDTDVVRGANSDKISNDAWQIAASWVLTGENNSFRGITPKRDFDLNAGTWGAWELAVRYHQLNVDDKVFEGPAATRYASATSTTEKASSWGLGVNWYLNKNLKVQTTYEQTSFDSGVAGVQDLEDEKVLFTRLQVAF
ncbi:porin [Pseudomethylobacillus aquaticus]|uniref:Porin n=1 Tax=Pseudomethylobacillus aquaticus TaxID=2676064 RepID=A0A3N0UW66_9PROT|nr:porin [Pseudomethylobacillus aquaticus]ROH84494.1 porin [Pseudomethylobacillus aquaticus]